MPHGKPHLPKFNKTTGKLNEPSKPPSGLTDAQKKAKRLKNTRRAMAALHMVAQHMQGKNPTNPFDEQDTDDASGKKAKKPESETPSGGTSYNSGGK